MKKQPVTIVKSNEQQVKPQKSTRSIIINLPGEVRVMQVAK